MDGALRWNVSLTIGAFIVILLSPERAFDRGLGGAPYPTSAPVSYAAFGPDGFTHVYVRSPQGAITQLTSGSHNDETPEWSFDGTKLAFQRGDTNGAAVYTMNADGSALTRLSPTPGSDALPGWSPDGTKIVFNFVNSQNSCNGNALATTSILTMSAVDGSGRTTLLDGTTATTCSNNEPRYSPDGTKIAFGCAPFNSGGQVCTIPATGGAVTFLTNTSFTVAADPHWNATGTKLAISRQDAAANVNVWTMNADGSGLTQVTTFVAPWEGGDAGWSLDGTQLVYEQDNGGQGQSQPNAPAGVSLVSASGSNPATWIVPCSGIGCGPRFQP